jgi:hypothetical protein
MIDKPTGMSYIKTRSETCKRTKGFVLTTLIENQLVPYDAQKCVNVAVSAMSQNKWKRTQELRVVFSRLTPRSQVGRHRCFGET